MGAKLSVLRACRRLLRPGGRLAFYTIVISPGLSEADYRRARQAGPSAVASRRDHEAMLRAAGFTKVATADVTPDFLGTARAWLETQERYGPQLRVSVGEAPFEERQEESRALVAAIEGGLLRRALFVAQRPRGRLQPPTGRKRVG